MGIRGRLVGRKEVQVPNTNVTFSRPKVPIPDFATLIREDPLYITCSHWKEYHWWLDNEACCYKCGAVWKDRKHTWESEVDCGCVAPTPPPPSFTREQMEQFALKHGNEKMLGVVGVSVHLVCKPK